MPPSPAVGATRGEASRLVMIGGFDVIDGHVVSPYGVTSAAAEVSAHSVESSRPGSSRVAPDDIEV
jgi:hypothetical protein